MTMTSNWTARLLTKVTACFMLLLMTTTMTIPSDALALRDGPRPVVVVPPRAYFLCWKGVCDPRLWDDMVKRNPYYSFGLGKRSVPQQEEQTTEDRDDDDDDDDLAALYKENPDNLYAMEKKSRYNFGVGKKDDNQRFRFGLGKRAGSDDGGRRFQFGLGKRSTDGDEDDEDVAQVDEEHVNDVNKRKSAYNFGLGKRDKMYSFGLGKRDKMYSFGLGKRSVVVGGGGGGGVATERLEKREIGKRGTSEDDKENEQSTRQQMTESTDKRARFGFGLGKRHNDDVDDDDDGHPVQVASATTVLPSSAGQPSKSL